jgi:ribonuclease P protein component
VAPATLKPVILKLKPATLKKRAEFLRVKGGPRWGTPGFALETRPRTDAPQEPPRFGFTVSKKVGGAVIRNRIRRRLRALVAALDPTCLQLGCDYVLIARPAAAERTYAELKSDLEQAIARVHRPQGQPRNSRKAT